MSDDNVLEFYPDDEAAVENDFWPHSTIPDWITLAHLDPIAYRFYGLLRAFANKAEGGHTAFPAQATVATLFGLSKPDRIGEAAKALEAIGAISRRLVRTNRGRRTIYRTYLEPRPGIVYTGPRMTSDLSKPGAMEAIAAERIKRRPDRVGRRPANARPTFDDAAVESDEREAQR